MSSAETRGALPVQDPSSAAHTLVQPTSVQPPQAALDQATQVSADRRRFYRVAVRLFGRFMRENKREYPCQVINISPGGLALRAPVAPEPGERIVAYIDELGRVEGDMVRAIDEGFAIRITASGYKREKLADQLTFLVNRDRLHLPEDRRHERIVPKNPFAQLSLADGTVLDCRILDVSLSGASVAVLPKPELGINVTIGKMRGKVVRHHEQGIGVEFSDVQHPNAICRHFG
ncbi:MAG: PilZ domain-containing protein [Methyloligellaceae bacterium]